MLNFTSRTTYYLSSTPTDMRNGRAGLAGIIREKMQRDPYSYDEAFIFYSKDYRKVTFMFSLFESCKLNDINLGDYIEDILTRLMEGEQDFMSLIPCNYNSNKKVNAKAA